MPYCTLDDIKRNRIPESVLIQLTDDENLGVVDEAVVNGAIADADEVIDGFARGRYPLPLTPVPGIVRTWSMDIATYGLYGRRAAFEPPKTVAERYTTALKLLERVQDGKLKLSDDEPVVEVGAGSAGEVLAANRVFSRDNLKGF